VANRWWNRWAIAGAMAMAVTMLAGEAHAQKGYNKGGSRAPDGVWFSGGINVAGGGWRGGAGVRLEAGIPLTLVGPGQLSLVIPLSTYHRAYGWGRRWDDRGWRGRTNVVQVVPELQWEYVFPIRMRHRLSISPQGGFGFGGLWHSHRDDPGAFLIIMKTGAVVRFGMENGFIVQMQPVGVLFNIPASAYYGFWASYEWYTTVGYRWK
jgi:hypothetical protein